MSVSLPLESFIFFATKPSKNNSIFNIKIRKEIKLYIKNEYKVETRLLNH